MKIPAMIPVQDLIKERKAELNALEVQKQEAVKSFHAEVVKSMGQMEEKARLSPGKEYCILCVQGINKDRLYPIGKGLRLGRSRSWSNIVYPQAQGYISKRHCEIWLQDGIPVIRDAGSTNGTFLADGKRLDSSIIRDLQERDRFYLADKDEMYELVVR